MINGVDVSQWQGAMDWQKCKSAGGQFALIRASFGNKTQDSQYDANMAGSLAAGIPRGAYHYCKPGGDWKKQAEFFSNLYAAYMPELPPVLDIEDDDDLSKAELESWLAKIIDRVEILCNKRSIIYTRASFFNSEMPLTDFAWRRQLWVAHYTSAPKPIIPLEWSNHDKSWVFWQWSADGNGQGSKYGAGSDDIDLDRFQGDRDEFHRLFGVWVDEGDEPPPPPELPAVIRAGRTLNLRDKPWGKITGKAPLGLLLHPEGVTTDEYGALWYDCGSAYVYAAYCEIV